MLATLFVGACFFTNLQENVCQLMKCENMFFICLFLL